MIESVFLGKGGEKDEEKSRGLQAGCPLCEKAVSAGRSNPESLLFPTAIGLCRIAWGERGVRALDLSVKGDLHPLQAPKEIARLIRRITRHLERGKDPFSDVRVDLEGVGKFDRSVFQAAREILPGNTATYGEVARRIGRPKAARAVGAALSRNPILIIIPCHRVIGSKGALVGFSANGGVELKERLLSIEGSALKAP